MMNQRFHAIIGEMADNEFLTPSLRRLLIDHTRISMTFYNPRNPRWPEQRDIAADQHDQFIALIEAATPRARPSRHRPLGAVAREIESFVTPPASTSRWGMRPRPRKDAHDNEFEGIYTPVITPTATMAASTATLSSR
jgi:hypothetical protein